MDKKFAFLQMIKELLGIDRPKGISYFEETCFSMDACAVPAVAGNNGASVAFFNQKEQKSTAEKKVAEPALGKTPVPEASNPEPPEKAKLQNPPEPVAEMARTVISTGTCITGQIASDGHVEILGNMQGDIEAKGNVRICGNVTGNIKGNSIELLSCRVQGNILSANDVAMDGGSVLIGDLEAVQAVIDGKVKGNVITRSSVSFNKNSVVLGDVTSDLVTVDQGAAVHGAIKVLHLKNFEKSFETL